MKETFRQSMAWLHTWTGLVTGWVLFFVFVTGSATYFDLEITRWMKPEIPLRVEQRNPPLADMAETALAYLARQPEAAPSWRITLPQDGRRVGYAFCSGDPGCPTYPALRGYPSDLTVQWAGHEVRLDSRTGAELPPPPVSRNTEGGILFKEMHYSLHYLPSEWGTRIVAYATVLGLLAIFTGIIVHKKIFKDFFTFRPNRGQRSWLDGHNVVSVMALPFFIMITYSGLAERGYLPKPLLEIPTSKPERTEPAELPPERLAIHRPEKAVMARIVVQAEAIYGQGEVGGINLTHRSGEDLKISLGRAWGTQYPFASSTQQGTTFSGSTGEAETDVDHRVSQRPAHQALWWIVGPHFGWFAGAGLRWLLFLSGLLGCVMIGTGLVLWTVKRREKHAKHAALPFGVKLVDRINVGVIVGLPIGVAAYFWANRVLPVTMDERAHWEAHALFLTWAWMLLYGFLRPAGKAWPELLALAALAFGLLPVLNAITTDKHLGVTIPHCDWVLASVDLTMFGFSAAFAFLAWKARNKARSKSGELPLPTAARTEAVA